VAHPARRIGPAIAYSAGYYAAAAPAYGYGAPQGYYNGQIVAETAPGRIGQTSTGNSAARSVQSALQTRGFYNGGIDGEFGPQSQQALAQFQQANGLKVTGLIDSSSLKSLGLR
jgi:peptidoglycan hydrolase-like protein with peptidoglycan-binding domain